MMEGGSLPEYESVFGRSQGGLREAWASLVDETADAYAALDQFKSTLGRPQHERDRLYRHAKWRPGRMGRRSSTCWAQIVRTTIVFATLSSWD